MALPKSTAMFTYFPSSTLLFFLLLSLPSFTGATDRLRQICGDTGNFTANSSYQSNLNTLLSALATNASASGGFAKGSTGQIPDKVNGLVLCRGDLNVTDCSACLDRANQESLQLCPFNKGVTIWYDLCFLRFSNEQFLDSTSNSRPFSMYNTMNVTQPEWFDRIRSQLFNATTDWAINNATNRFATGQVSIFTPEIPTVYGMVQCVPDLSRLECGQCLRSLFQPVPEIMKNKVGGRVIGEVCSMWYEIWSFFQGVPALNIKAELPEGATEPAAAAAPPPAILVANSGKKGIKNVTRTLLAIVITAAILLISFVCICFWRGRRQQIPPHYETEPEKITSDESILFEVSTLRVATSYFSQENKIGEGGFGEVYKGLLPDGREIAVKRLLNSRHGLEELKNELVLVAKLQHRNLVKLVGFCLEEEKMIVYEYVPNRSLDKVLFDGGEQLQWGTRYKIITGIARGLLYLHEESQLKIIHRDLKANNILLDAVMNPKISDFGLAKLFDDDQTHASTNRIMGTFGYMAPEYAMHGHFSIKSDVFSFGVLVLEILTGKRNSGSYDSQVAEDLLSSIWAKWNGGGALEIVDRAMGGHYRGSDVLRCIQIGLLCVQENPVDRPSMRMVDLMLTSATVSLQVPSRPAFCVEKTATAFGVNNSTSHSSTPRRGSRISPALSTNDVSLTDLEPR